MIQFLGRDRFVSMTIDVFKSILKQVEHALVDHHKMKIIMSSSPRNLILPLQISMKLGKRG